MLKRTDWRAPQQSANDASEPKQLEFHLPGGGRKIKLMPKSKSPVFTLVPGTGKKLSDLARSLDAINAALSALLGALGEERADFLPRMLRILESLHDAPGLSPEDHKTIGVVADTLKHMIAALPR